MPGDTFCVRALVERPAATEGDGESAERPARHPLGLRDDERRVDAPREEGADFHVRDEVSGDRPFEPPASLVDCAGRIGR